MSMRERQVAPTAVRFTMTCKHLFCRLPKSNGSCRGLTPVWRYVKQFIAQGNLIPSSHNHTCPYLSLMASYCQCFLENVPLTLKPKAANLHRSVITSPLIHPAHPSCACLVLLSHRSVRLLNTILTSVINNGQVIPQSISIPALESLRLCNFPDLGSSDLHPPLSLLGLGLVSRRCLFYPH